MLLFDVSTPYKLQHLLGDRFWGEDLDDIGYLWQNRYFAAGCRVDMHLSIFVREPGGLYQKITEEQTQYGHTRAKLTALLLAAGFADVAFTGDRTLQAPAAKEKTLAHCRHQEGAITFWIPYCTLHYKTAPCAAC